MPFKDHAPRLSFLKDSASFLSATSPSTAAYLMSVHNAIFHEESKALNQRLHDTFCGACGSPRKAEWTKTVSVRKRVQKQASSSVASKSLTADGATVYKCLRCRRRTVIPGRTPAKAAPATLPIANNPLPAASTAPAALPGQASGSAYPSKASRTAENASSKKRAKARKQGGLQALLAAKQTRSSASPSLDLFDFLQ